jgi:hypothetical protein
VEIDETKTGALLPRRPRGRRRRIDRDDKTTDFIVLIAMENDRSPPPVSRIQIVFFSFFFLRLPTTTTADIDLATCAFLSPRAKRVRVT